MAPASARPEPGMDQEADGQEHRDPGQIDDRDRCRTGQESHGSGRGRARAGVPSPEWRLAGQADDRLVQRQPRRTSSSEAVRATRCERKVEHALKCIGGDEQNRQRNQRRHAPAAQARDRRPAACRAGRRASAGSPCPRTAQHSERAPAFAQGLRDVGMDWGFSCKHLVCPNKASRDTRSIHHIAVTAEIHAAID